MKYKGKYQKLRHDMRASFHVMNLDASKTYLQIVISDKSIFFRGNMELMLLLLT